MSEALPEPQVNLPYMAYQNCADAAVTKKSICPYHIYLTVPMQSSKNFGVFHPKKGYFPYIHVGLGMNHRYRVGDHLKKKSAKHPSAE